MKTDNIKALGKSLTTRINGAVISAIYSEFDTVIVPKNSVLSENNNLVISITVGKITVSRTVDVIFGFQGPDYFKSMDDFCDEMANEFIDKYRASVKEKTNES